MLRRHWKNVLLLALVGLAIGLSTPEFREMQRDRPIYPGPGVTEERWLSEYYPPLAHTPFDTPVYILEGEKPGATVLVVGGTHPNEPAGFLTAVLLVERAIVRQGRLIVIPRANRSGFTHTEPGEGCPSTFKIQTHEGTREFRFGSRLTNPVHQWPDPVVYINKSGQQLAGSEVRNLNRCYPGDPNGFPTERLAYAIMQLIRSERPAMAFDLHEASPEYPVINTIVAHPKGLDLAVEVAMELESKGIQIGVEVSPENLHGLSHREWGDHTDTLPFLMEVANPSQGRLRGRTDERLILTGQDKYYLRAASRGWLYVEYTAEGWTLERRVGRHLEALAAFFRIYSERHPEAPIVVEGLPSLEELEATSLGEFLASPGRT